MLRIRAAVTALLLTLLAAAPAAATADPFTGSWSATDLDVSAMAMNISNGPTGTYQVVLVGVYAAKTYETFHQESGMRYQFRHFRPGRGHPGDT